MDTGKEERPIELPVPVVPEEAPVPEKTPAAEPEKVVAP